MSFFSTVRYGDSFQDKGWLGKCEEAAHVCWTPARWVGHELCKTGHSFMISKFRDSFEVTGINYPPSVNTIQKVMRLVFGVILAIPGGILGSVFMGIAYISPEIRLKHRIVDKTKTYSEEEKKELNDMIKKRQELERKGGDGGILTCPLLCCILCILCCKK